MTRKDFQLIADSIASMQLQDYTPFNQTILRTYIAKQFADALRATNSRFNRDKFMMACGAEE